MKIKFTCQTCGKTIMVQRDIFDKLYVGWGKCLDCRKNDGGKMEGVE
jgi:hypothetical protein